MAAAKATFVYEYGRFNMRIKILGTAAEQGWPPLFSKSHGSHRSMELGGKHVRSRSSLLIDACLKIDFPADTFHQAVTQQLLLDQVKYLLLTRSSYHNVAPEELSLVLQGLADFDGKSPLNVFGNTETVEKLKGNLGKKSALLFEIQAFQTLSLGNYLIHPIRAHNNGDREPLNYLIRKGKHSMLYVSDTGLYAEPSLRFLRYHKLDLVLCGCRCGAAKAVDPYSMGFPEALELKRRFEKEGISHSKTLWYLTQLHHQDNILHEELEALVSPFGFQVAWDGLELDLSRPTNENSLVSNAT